MRSYTHHHMCTIGPSIKVTSIPWSSLSFKIGCTLPELCTIQNTKLQSFILRRNGIEIHILLPSPSPHPPCPNHFSPMTAPSTNTPQTSPSCLKTSPPLLQDFSPLPQDFSPLASRLLPLASRLLPPCLKTSPPCFKTSPSCLMH